MHSVYQSHRIVSHSTTLKLTTNYSTKMICTLIARSDLCHKHRILEMRGNRILDYTIKLIPQILLLNQRIRMMQI